MLNTNLDNSTIIVSEKQLFESILTIPVSKDSWFSLYSNTFNVEEVLDDCLDDLKEIYLPYLKKYHELGVVYHEKEGAFHIKNTVNLREELIDNLPSKLISGLLIHDENDLNEIITHSSRLGELKVSYDEKMRKAFVSNFTSYKQMYIRNSIKRILNKHRNSRVFFIFMSKWFFIGFWLFKLSIKLMVIFYIYKKR